MVKNKSVEKVVSKQQKFAIKYFNYLCDLGKRSRGRETNSELFRKIFNNFKALREPNAVIQYESEEKKENNKLAGDEGAVPVKIHSIVHKDALKEVDETLKTHNIELYYKLYPEEKRKADDAKLARNVSNRINLIPNIITLLGSVDTNNISFPILDDNGFDSEEMQKAIQLSNNQADRQYDRRQTHKPKIIKTLLFLVTFAATSAIASMYPKAILAGMLKFGVLLSVTAKIIAASFCLLAAAVGGLSCLGYDLYKGFKKGSKSHRNAFLAKLFVSLVAVTLLAVFTSVAALPLVLSGLTTYLASSGAKKVNDKYNVTDSIANFAKSCFSSRNNDANR
ncbi:MAG: hypothetical protein COB50_02150 [Thiotrichales bacterium]|nr:MAG: hypothetical protein COB50_02150 [Thiotrichales bacterium]